ncbi:MAG: shikimate kinase [Sphaerochaetaceae bacterium]|nr:shikimate kinase [Sphaerochaetaceae bacterium]
MDVIIILGIKHSGKTTLAKLLGEKKNYIVFDLDIEMKKTFYADYASLRKGYEVLGKQYFMKSEYETLKNILKQLNKSSNQRKAVIATGGGICDDQDSLNLLKTNKFPNLILKTVFIKVPESILLSRIMKTGIPPFLEEDNIKESFHILFNKREKLYSDFCQYMLQLEDYMNKDQIIDFLDEINC